MLNYVWLTILFLGIGAAVSSDIIDQSYNRQRNNYPVPVEVSFNQGFESAGKGTYDARIRISYRGYNQIFNDTLKADLIIPAKITCISSQQAAVNLVVDKNYPELLLQKAGFSGKENDISGTFNIKDVRGDSLALGTIVMEEVNFLKMKEITNAALDYAGTAVEIALGLIGIMALWLGVMKVAEQAGLISIIANALKPVTKKLFPEVPSDHPAMGAMIMNISANMLGLGNAATPFGLKAMDELDKLNPQKGTATNSMITFLAINTAGMTLIPATAIAIRAAAGSSDPAIIIGTSLFGSFCATVTGITAVKIMEKFPLRKNSFSLPGKNSLKGIFILAGLIAIAALLIFTGAGKIFTSAFSFLTPGLFKNIIQVFSTLAIPLLIFIFIGYGAIKKVKVYETFVEGAKEGFNVAIRIIPYLVAMLMAIGIFRAGGAMDWLVYILRPFTDLIGMPAEALPMALMRPLSGSGSLGIMSEIISVHGPDSFLGIMVSTFYGSTETTFYVLAVYFGAVNIKNTRHALPAGLLADVAGILGAVFIVRLLFG
jgi:spore maturation protein SpmA